MKKFTGRVASFFIKDSENREDPKVRTRYGILEGWVSIVGNIALALIKFAAGFYVHSASLIADAVHTLSDSATSVVVIIGFKMAGKKPDDKHPFGHGRMESVAGLVVSVLLMVAGIELIKHSLEAIFNPLVTTADTWVILVVILTMLVKEVMARFSYELGDLIDSDTLRADAMHHRSDALSTLLVVAALIAGRFGFGAIDGYMGILVSGVVLYSGYAIARDAVDPLLGEPPSGRILADIEEVTSSISGIYGVHGIVFHKYGSTGIISMHIEVSADEKALRLHEIAEQVEEAVREKTGKWVVVHVDPVNYNHPQYGMVKEFLTKITGEEKFVGGFHDLRILGSDSGKINVVFDICFEKNMDEGNESFVISGLKQKFLEEFDDMDVVIRTDPRFNFRIAK